MARYPDGQPIYEAAQRWKQECLLRDGSLFSPLPLWSSTNLDYLERFFIRALDPGEGAFWDKLKIQLEDAPPDAVKLAAEMFWVMFLFLSDDALLAASKWTVIQRVWKWSGEELSETPEIIDPLSHGVGHPGTAYNTHRWREFAFFIQMMQAWKRLPQERQAHLADSPWEMAVWIDGLEESRARQLRHLLLHLLFPDDFERIGSGRRKREIVKVFGEQVGRDHSEFRYQDRGAVDQEIAVIREHLQERYGRDDLDFYEEPLREQWIHDADKSSTGSKKEPEPGDHDPWWRNTFGESRVWLLSPGEGARLWPEFQREGLIAIGWDFLGDLNEYDSKLKVGEAITAELGVANPMNDQLACWQFGHEMSPGDFVLAKRGRSALLGWGRVTSDYRFEPDRAEYMHVRDVRWDLTGEWKIPKERRVTNKTLTEMTPAWIPWLRDALAHMREGIAWPEPSEPATPSRGSGYSLATALEGLFLPPEQFTRILDALGRKKNVIILGPPGVGKTFIAKRLAWRLMDDHDPSRLEMVQFHQSYSYEDFLQGWRPTESGGFELRNGVFYEFCRRAAGDPERPYVFIIDEINRGNLSKILGEAMMLIESDKRGSEYAVPLTYSTDSERFFIPANVHVLGMMNTADRSLAMVDYALRRRFAFVSLSPAFGSDAFTEYLLEAGMDEPLVARIVDRLTALNEHIRADAQNLGPGYEIGHSYFVPGEDTEDALDEAWFETVVRSELEPLLKEYWFDDPEKVRGYVAELLA